MTKPRLKCRHLFQDMYLQGSTGDLVDEGMDLAIHLGGLEDTSMVVRKLASSMLVVCGSPEYLAKHGVPKKPEDLVNHSCLVNWAIPPRNNWQFKGDDGYIVMNVSVRMQANAAHPIRLAAINDLGLVILPTYIVGDDLEKGLLKRVWENYKMLSLAIYAVYPHRKYLSAKVRGFMDYLQKDWKILFVPSARVTHAQVACSRSRPIFVEWHKQKGMMRFYRKFFRHQYPGILMGLVALGLWLRFGLVSTYYTSRRAGQALGLGRG